MRILYMGIGDAPAARALPQSWPDRLFGRTVGRHEVLTFGHGDGLDIRVPVGATFDEVLAGLPAGWVPDVCVCTHVDHLLIPPGIEHAPFPTVAITADWDFRIATARTMVAAFDLTIALGDQSCRAVRTLGARHAFPFAYFGVPEQELEGELAPVDNDRPIDVLFTGTINDFTHLDRSQWLLRLTRLSEKYRIVIGQPGASPGAYRQLLQQTKLVFTFHRRGELQLRFTDAVTQGAAVLDNGVETARHYRPGVEYIAYDEDNFEEVVEQHLANPSRRHAIVAAARQRTKVEFGSVRRFELLFDQLEVFFSQTPLGPRPAASLPATETARRMVEQLHTSHYDTCMGPSRDYLAAAQGFAQQCGEGPRASNDAAVLLHAQACAGDSLTVDDSLGQRAIVLLEELVARHPNYVVGHYNLAQAYKSRHQFDGAGKHFALAQELLLSEHSEFDPWALLPRRETREYRAFLRTYSDALFASLEQGTDTEPRRVLAAECWHELAVIQHYRGQVVEALASSCYAIELAPDRGDFARFGARAADLLGLREEACRHYRRTRELLPFDFDGRMRTMSFMVRSDLIDEARNLLVETVAMCRANRQDDAMIERLRLLVSAIGHAQAGAVVRGDLLLDQFALEAVRELCDHLEKNPDPRLHRRVGELLYALGKTESADRWLAEAQPLPAAEPIVMEPARTAVTKDSMRPSTSAAVRT